MSSCCCQKKRSCFDNVAMESSSTWKIGALNFSDFEDVRGQKSMGVYRCQDDESGPK